MGKIHSSGIAFEGAKRCEIKGVPADFWCSLTRLGSLKRCQEWNSFSADPRILEMKGKRTSTKNNGWCCIMVT